MLADRAFALAERLGSVNAAAAQLGTTWPSRRKAFQRHGLGMSAGNPEAVCQHAIDAARQRTGRPAIPSLDPVLVALNHGELPVGWGAGPSGCSALRTTRSSTPVVVELHTESHAERAAWAITRRAERAHRRHQDREQRGERHQAGRVERTSRPQPERELVADGR